jgi:MFS family permease
VPDAQREQSEKRRPTAEGLGVASIERSGVPGRVGGGAVPFLPRFATAPLAGPSHHLAVGSETSPVAENAAGKHRHDGTGSSRDVGAMSGAQLGVIETNIPSRLDRLPWSRFHWRIVFGLGTAWVLDGLEVTIVGSVASRLTEHGSGVSIGPAGIGLAAALYVVGACCGALVFGHLTDRFGRKKLFVVTLALYMVATAVTALSFTAWFFYLFRLLTGAGIGGEYAAINSAIDELIPARARGRIDLVINGSYWIGSLMGSALAILFLDEAIFPTDIGWRLTFVLGILLASVLMLVRRHVPESPRWLFIHGHEEQAEAVVDRIEADVQEQTGSPLQAVDRTLVVRQRRTIAFRSIVRTAIRQYPTRSVLCLALFVGQAFIYNGITFDLGTLMSKFFGVSSGIAPVFLILYAAANFVGPLVLGRLFDTVGRIPMISGTYIGSAVLGLLLAGLFAETGLLGQWSFIVVVMATFFLASAGASAAYLTTSEIFPMETRAMSIAFFYAVGTAAGGIAGPLLFGPLISTGSRGLVSVAFLVGSALMLAGGATELVFGVKAEQQPLEDVARPLTAEDAERTLSTRSQERTMATRGEGAAAATAAGGAAGSPQAAERRARAAEHRAAAAGHRASAAEHRAAAAEHRARFHEVLADVVARGGTERGTRAEGRIRAKGGAPAEDGAPVEDGADERLEVEQTLALVCDARALAEEERATAEEARARLQLTERVRRRTGTTARGRVGPRSREHPRRRSIPCKPPSCGRGATTRRRRRCWQTMIVKQNDIASLLRPPSSEHAAPSSSLWPRRRDRRRRRPTADVATGSARRCTRPGQPCTNAGPKGWSSG